MPWHLLVSTEQAKILSSIQYKYQAKFPIPSFSLLLMNYSKLILLLLLSIFARAVQDFQLYKQTSAYSHEPPVEYKNRPVKRLRVASCEKITTDQMKVLVSEYPNFIVTCEKEMTILYPSELDYEVGRAKEMKKDSKRKENLKFTELKVIARRDEETFRIPLFQCIYASHTNASGSIEFKFTIGNTKGKSKKINAGIPIPHFGISYSLGISNAVSRLFVIHHSCNFDEYAVRPIIAMTTTKVSFKQREWDISKTKEGKGGKWKKLDRVVFTDEAPLFFCLSELYVPDVCNWPADRARDEDGDEVRIVDIEEQ